MGMQTRFFLIDKDELDFLEYISSTGDFFVDVKGEELSIEELINSNRGVFYTVSQTTDLVYDAKRIDTFRSSIVELMRCIKDPDNRISYGRIYANMRYYNDKDELIAKDKTLKDRFAKYKKWILKNCYINNTKDFYIGKTTYQVCKSQNYKCMYTKIDAMNFDDVIIS